MAPGKKTLGIAVVGSVAYILDGALRPLSWAARVRRSLQDPAVKPYRADEPLEGRNLSGKDAVIRAVKLERDEARQDLRKLRDEISITSLKLGSMIDERRREADYISEARLQPAATAMETMVAEGQILAEAHALEEAQKLVRGILDSPGS